MSKLVILESPGKAKTVKKYLGKDYDVVACMGHIRDLPKSKMGVNIEKNFEPMYMEMTDKKEIISTLKSKAKEGNKRTAFIFSSDEASKSFNFCSDISNSFINSSRFNFNHCSYSNFLSIIC